jgi:predicted ATPase
LFASVLSLEVPEGRYPPLNMSPQKQKDETLQALSNQVSTRSNQQPLLLIFEDAHWIDPTSQELLDLIIPSVADKRVLLIITYRPEYEPPWAQTLGHLTLINLNRLGKRQASMMVERVTGGKPLPDEVLEQIVAKTDGVPLFVEELTKTVIGSGIVKEGDEAYELTGPLTDLTIPSTIQDSLMARLDRLAPVREVAQIGACIGREFSHALLAAVSQMRGEALTDAIRHLIASELIYSVGTPPDATYTFKHALVQDAAHMSLLRTRRQQLHGQVADAMIEQFSALAEGTPETVAHHLTEARRTEQAITYWQRAGVAASQKSSNVEAVAHLEKALSLITQLPDNDDRARKELALLNIVAAPMMNSRGYAAPELGRLYERAYALCEKLGGGEQIIQALSGICQYHMVVGDMNTALGYARETLARAEKQTGRGPILEAHRLLGLSYAWQGSPRKSLEHFRAVQDFYDAEQDQDLALTYGQNHLMSSYSLGACPLALLGYPNQSDVFMEKAISAAYASGHVYSIAYALTLPLVRHTCLREHSEILSGASKVIPLCEEQNIPFYLAFARLFNGFALAQQGNLDEGIERMRDALVLYGWTGSGMFLPFFDTLLAETLLQNGEWDEARDLLTFAKQRTEEWGEAFYYAETLRVLGDHEAFCPDADRKAAEIRYQEAIAAAQNRELRVWELRAAISLARLWQSQGKNREAHDLLFPISDWFTEGFDMPDLKDAKALLEELT